MAEIINNILILILVISSVIYLIWNRNNLVKEIQRQKEVNQELLKRIPVTNDGVGGIEPLSVEQIADAIRFEGYYPEIEDNYVKFKVQGEGYYVDANRLPLLFILKGYGVDPNEWEMDLLKDAAHKMSDQLVMVKATFSDDDKDMRFFVAARDRNYESFRGNFTSYLSILEDGQRVMNEEYNKMLDEKRAAALKAHPDIPFVQPKNMMS
jgi:hypothetical protein